MSWALKPNATAIQPYCTSRESLRRFQVVGSNDKGAPNLLKGSKPLETSIVELGVTDCKDLVQQKDVGFDRGRHRKTQARTHP